MQKREVEMSGDIKRKIIKKQRDLTFTIQDTTLENEQCWEGYRNVMGYRSQPNIDFSLTEARLDFSFFLTGNF